ncbi:P49 [Xanthomonas phage phiL7]|uniref:p49 n=1 Tax=Xanthomonas phage phiL7 TaxID=538979 RepID=C4ML49_9CAUD|nr:P49 [Xanthomonas phage phiL7]ACE75789.1 P49 [Xanthomonas phage phiL7]
MDKLNYKQAKALLTYCPSTGEVQWRGEGAGRRKDHKVGTKTSGGYIRVEVLGKSYMVHRLAWLLHYGQWPNGLIDHANGIRDDNRIGNLRQVRRCVHAWNRKSYKGKLHGIARIANEDAPRDS